MNGQVLCVMFTLVTKVMSLTFDLLAPCSRGCRSHAVHGEKAWSNNVIFIDMNHVIDC